MRVLLRPSTVVLAVFGLVLVLAVGFRNPALGFRVLVVLVGLGLLIRFLGWLDRDR